MKKNKKNEEQIQEVTVEVTEIEVQSAELQITEEALEAVSEENSSVESTSQLVTDINEIESAVLALIFASPVALTSKKLKNLLTSGGYDVSQLDLVIESLTQNFEARGIQLLKVSGGYQMRTHPKHAELVQKLVEEKPQRLSRSALEVLSIIAYKQPLTRADVDHVRGTDSGHIVKSLLEKNLVRTEGHKESAGRPLLYGTTPYFLEVFSLGSLDDLPALEEFERELQESDVTVLDADPGFYDRPSALDAEADRGTFDSLPVEESEKADFGEAERAKEELSSES
jgi:segregation and condensation protein B